MRLPEPPIRDLAEKGFAATHPLLLHVQVHAVLCGAALHFVIQGLTETLWLAPEFASPKK